MALSQTQALDFCQRSKTSHDKTAKDISKMRIIGVRKLVLNSSLLETQGLF